MASLVKVHSSITTERLIEAIESGDSVGFCIACGGDAYGVEPDAREHTCEGCEESAVYGAEELLLMGVGQ